VASSRRERRAEASLPPDPGILGFHPENVKRVVHRHSDALKKRTTSADAAIMAQQGKDFPQQV
jgi:hypothetical protein